MNTLKPLAYLPYILMLALWLLASCQGNNKNIQQLEKAMQLMESSPQDALLHLDSVQSSKLDDEQYAQFILVQARSLDKLGKAAPSDKAVSDACNYFIKKQNAPYAALGSFISGKEYYKQGNYDLALINYHIADGWAKKAVFKIPNFNYAAIPYAIAAISYESGDYTTSNGYVQKALFDLEQQKQKPAFYPYALELMGMNYVISNKLDSAMLNYTKALQIAASNNDTISLLRIEHNKSILLIKEKKYMDAKQICQQTISSINPSDSISIGMTLIYLAKAYSGLNQLDSANSVIYYSKHLLQNANNRIKQSLYETLISIEEKNGNKEQALEYQKQSEEYQRLIDEQNEKIQKAVDEQQSGTDKIVEQLNEHRNRMELMEQNSKMFGIAFCILLITSGGFATKVLASRRNTIRKMYSKLERKNSIKNELLIREQSANQNNLFISLVTQSQTRFVYKYQQLIDEAALYKKGLQRQFRQIQRALKFQTGQIAMQAIDLDLLASILKDRRDDRHLQNTLLEDMMQRTNWKETQLVLHHPYGDVFKKVRDAFPMFNEWERRIITLIGLDFHSNEIAGLLRITDSQLRATKRNIEVIAKEHGLLTKDIYALPRKFADDPFPEINLDDFLKIPLPDED